MGGMTIANAARDPHTHRRTRWEVIAGATIAGRIVVHLSDEGESPALVHGERKTIQSRASSQYEMLSRAEETSGLHDLSSGDILLEPVEE